MLHTIYCIHETLQTMLNNNGDSFLDLEVNLNICPSLFESCLPIYNPRYLTHSGSYSGGHS